MSRHNRPTLADVALEAGVSSQTVSRVVNDRQNVSQDAYARVVAAARKLNYLGNGAARALQLDGIYSVGVLVPANLSPHDTRLLGAIVSSAAQLRTRIDIIVPSVLPHTDGEPPCLTDFTVDGFIVLAGAGVAGMLGTRVPVVGLNGVEPELCARQVLFDLRPAFLEVVTYLIRTGHRTIHLVGGPPSDGFSRQVLDAWRSAMLHLSPAAAGEFLEGAWSSSTGYQAARRLLSNCDSSSTAIICASDVLALGVSRFYQQEYRGDCSQVPVVSIGDSNLASYSWPPLSSVRLDLESVGDLGLRLMMDALENGISGMDLIMRVDCEFVVRSSATRPT